MNCIPEQEASVTNSQPTLRLHLDLPTRVGIGAAFIQVYERSDGFSLVLSTEYASDCEVELTRAEFAQLTGALAALIS